MKHKTIKQFKGVAAGIDSTDAGDSTLSYAENVILRPTGAISRLPPLKKVWGLDKIQFYKEQLGISDADGTCILKISQPNTSAATQNEIILAHDFKNNLPLGMFFLQSETISNAISLDNISQYEQANLIDCISVLKKGLAENERWFFYSFFDSVMLGNGVDDNLIYQRTRTDEPLRLLGTSQIPDVPILLSQNVIIGLKNAKTIFNFTVARFVAPPRILAETLWDQLTQKHFMILRWTPTDSASSYQIDFSYDIDFSTKTTINIIAETAWQFEELLPNKRLYFRIRAKYNTNGEFFFSPYTNGSHSTPSFGFAGTLQGYPSQTAVIGIIPEVATLTIMAKGTFSYENGNNIIVNLESSGTELSSGRSGEGTINDPLIYTVSGCGTATVRQLADYISGDYLVTGILSVSTSGVTNSYGITSQLDRRLSGGYGTPEDVEKVALLANSQIAVTYFDPGTNNQGLESGLSVPINILTAGIKTIRPVYKNDPELNRFSKFRIYYRIPATPYATDLPTEKWILLGDCPNESGTEFTAFAKKLSQDTIFLSSEGEKTIDRAPPCNVFELCGNRLFASGNKANSKRIWYSNPATTSILLPEAFNVADQWIDMQSTKEDGTPSRVTLLQALGPNLQVHTDKGIVMMDATTFNIRNSRSDFGALNPAASTNWRAQNSPYLGSDGVLYEMQNQQVLKSLIANETSWDFTKKFIDTEALVSNPNRVNVFGDFTNQLVWVWMPCIINNQKQLGGFIYDARTKGITGPLTSLGFVSVTIINATDARLIGQTENGNVAYLDSRDLNLDIFDNEYTYSGDFIEDKNNIYFATNFYDLGTPTTNKVFGEIIFTLAKGSKAENIIVSISTDDGKKSSINFGLANKEKNKIVFLLSGYNAKIEFYAETIPNRPFVLRDITLGYNELRNL